MWLQGGMCGCGGCMVVSGQQHAWLWGVWLQGGVHGCRGHAWLWEACMVLGGHAWLWGACVVGAYVVVGVCVVARGTCVVMGGMCGCGGHVWLWGGIHGCEGACIGYDEIRSMSGRYASYWNAFLSNIQSYIAEFYVV